MKALIRRLFGRKSVDRGPAADTDAEADDYAEVPGARYFEIVPDLAYGAKGAYPARELDVLVTVDHKRSEHLRQLRVDAFAARHPYGYKPYDVFGQCPNEPIDPEHVIDEGKLKKKVPRTLPEISVFQFNAVVSRRVKEAIESLEPGAHCFYPFNITSYDGAEMHEYFFIQFRERPDCVDYVRSGFERIKSSATGNYYWSAPRTPHQVYLRDECVDGRHLFLTDGIHGMIVSDGLREKLGDFLPRGKTLEELRVVRKRDP